MAYNYLTTETEAEHAERIGAEETSEETRWCDTCKGWEPTATLCEKAEAARLAEEQAGIVKPKAKATIRRQTLICSCGYTTCSLIGRYGLTVPTFQGEIFPIPTQYVRDRRAEEIKAAGGL